MKLFAIFDRKAEGFQAPFPVPTLGQAERAFLDACMEDGTDLAKHPEDYALYLVGEFDQSSGEVVAEMVHVANGSGRPILSEAVADA